MLPPQLDTDQMRALGPRSSRYLDPFKTSNRKVSVYWGLLASFAGSWAAQAVLVTLNAFATLGSPVGTNRLLAYIESGGAHALVRPWVWIVFIALAPLIQNAAEQLYIYYNTRTATHMEAVITSTVYRHSLRIRVLNKADEELPPPTPATPELPKANRALGSTQAPGSAEASVSEVATVHSRAETSASTSSTVVGSENGDGKKGKDSKDAADETDKKDKKAQDIIGKLNNLVTADLDNITGGKDWLFYSVNSVLQVGLGSWFLYSILGWSAWVGLGVMVLLAPIPAWVSTFMNGVQKKKMKATDLRVTYIKEVLSILRMVKQFGWESRVKREIDAKREEELYWTFRRAILQLVNMVTKYGLSSLSPLLDSLLTAFAATSFHSCI
jgi:ABC-type multidrug transport system fused ATPase/permease subunit